MHQAREEIGHDEASGRGDGNQPQQFAPGGFPQADAERGAKDEEYDDARVLL